MYLVLLSTIILLQPLGSSFLPSIEGILILLAASGPPLPLTTVLLLLLRWLRHNGGERRALPNSLTQLGAAPPGRWSVRPTTISAPPWLALWKFFLFLLQLRIFVSTKGILKHCLSSLRKP